MNYNEVKKELKKEFENFLKPLGYKSKTDPQGCKFIKINAQNTFTITYGVANYIDEFNTGLVIGIENNKLEEIQKYILNEFIGFAIGSGTSDFFNEINYRFKIQTIEDIKEWGKIVRKFYEEYAVPFFEKYNTIDAIDKLLNDHPTEKVIYLDDLGWRIIKGLIAAKLNNNPKYNELRDYYFGVIYNANKKLLETKNRGFFMYEKCIKTIDFLDTHSQEELLKIAES